MLVKDALKRDNNNLDLIRIFCAISVIFAHSYYLANTDGAQEPVQSVFTFTYTGSIAVKIFFFISGMLVTNSLLTTRNIPHFISSRFFRIFPAFIFVLLFATFIVGPLLTTHSMTSYLKDTLTYSYLFKSSYLDMQFFLPGVFEENIYKSSVNGSLWTIPYEVASYVVLLACYMITQSRGRIIPSIICLSIIALPVLGWNKLIFINNDNADVFLMAPCFALGALYAINKDKLYISPHAPIGFAILYNFVSDPTLKHMLFYFCACTFFVYLSTTKIIKSVRIKHDVSYGVYLWGFLIQQITFRLLPDINLYLNQVLCIALSLIAGLISFIAIEKPAMDIGKKISNKFRY